MAKKKMTELMATPMAYEPPPVPDNHTKGVAELPNGGWKGYDYKDQMFFPGNLDGGESPRNPDVITQNANGTVCSCGEGNNQQYNWENGDAGHWNKNRGWPGSNRTGE